MRGKTWQKPKRPNLERKLPQLKHWQEKAEQCDHEHCTLDFRHAGEHQYEESED